MHHFLDQRSIPANGFVSISFSDFTILAVFGAHGVVIADVWQAYVGAELAQVGVLFVVMFTAAVVMAGGVAINHGPREIARNDFVDRHSGRSAMQGDAQLVEQLDGAATNAATDDIGATLGSEEARHGAMLVLRGLFDNSFGDFPVFNGDKSHLRGFAEMRPKLAVGSGNGYFLVLHDDMMLFLGAKIGKKHHER